MSIATTAEVARDKSRSYEALRREVLRKAKYRCQCEDCKASGFPLIAQEVDHIVPLWRGGAASDEENLQAMNRDCHAKKTEAERADRIALGVWAGLKYP